MTGILRERGDLDTDTTTWGECHVTLSLMQPQSKELSRSQERGLYRAVPSAFRRSMALRPLDLELLASRAVRNKFLLLKPPSLWCFGMAALRNKSIPNHRITLFLVTASNPEQNPTSLNFPQNYRAQILCQFLHPRPTALHSVCSPLLQHTIKTASFNCNCVPTA